MCTALMLLPLGASAQLLKHNSNLYLSAFIDRQSLGEPENSAELRPIVSTAVIGYWVRPGIGLEFGAGFGLVDDSIGELDADLTSELALNLRLESPPRGKYAAYALFGYVRSAYDLSNGAFDSSITLPGGRLAVGLTYVLDPKLRVDAAFSHHDYNGDTRINSFRLGLRYDFNPRVF